MDTNREIREWVSGERLGMVRIYLHLHVSDIFSLSQCHSGLDLEPRLFGEEIDFLWIVLGQSYTAKQNNRIAAEWNCMAAEVILSSRKDSKRSYLFRSRAPSSPTMAVRCTGSAGPQAHRSAHRSRALHCFVWSASIVLGTIRCPSLDSLFRPQHSKWQQCHRSRNRFVSFWLHVRKSQPTINPV